ncbi:MAG: hypothetical protein ACOC34_06765 [Thermotogota bacterium]
MDSKKRGTTFIELIVTLLIFSLMIIPIGFGVGIFNQPIKEKTESLFLTSIRNQIMLASSESLHSLKETKIVYNKGDEINGFVFSGRLQLDFTVYGQLKQGKSVVIMKEKDRFRLSIRPITGVVTLKRE